MFEIWWNIFGKDLTNHLLVQEMVNEDLDQNILCLDDSLLFYKLSFHVV